MVTALVQQVKRVLSSPSIPSLIKPIISTFLSGKLLTIKSKVLSPLSIHNSHYQQKQESLLQSLASPEKSFQFCKPTLREDVGLFSSNAQKNKMLNVVLLDLDGTLLATAEQHRAAIEKIAREKNKPIPYANEEDPTKRTRLYKRTLYNPLIKGFTDFFGADDATETSRRFKEVAPEYVIKAKPMRGADNLIKVVYDHKVLQKAKGVDIKIIVFTYSEQKLAEKCLEVNNWTQYVDYVHGSDPDGKYPDKSSISLLYNIKQKISHFQALPLNVTGLPH